MITVQLDSTTTASGKEFTLTDVEVDKSNETRMSIRADSTFDNKSVKMQVANPATGVWYETGISFSSAVEAAVIKLRPNYKYRLLLSAIGGAPDIEVMFF